MNGNGGGRAGKVWPLTEDERLALVTVLEQTHGFTLKTNPINGITEIRDAGRGNGLLIRSTKDIAEAFAVGYVYGHWHGRQPGPPEVVVVALDLEAKEQEHIDQQDKTGE
jgi:hypothetical protein